MFQYRLGLPLAFYLFAYFLSPDTLIDWILATIVLLVVTLIYWIEFRSLKSCLFIFLMLPLFFQLGRFRQQSEEKAIVENDIRYESPLILEPLGVPEVTAKGYRLAVKCHLKDSSDLKILLNVKGTATIDIAKYWTCASLHIQVLPFNRNPGAFDYGDWLQKKGFQAISYVNADKLLELNSSTSRISQQFFKWRWSCVQYIQSKLQGPSSLQIVPALLLGYKSSVDREVRQSFTASGIVHILAVSGMHLGLIYALLQWLLRPFRKSRKGVIVIQLIGIWAFTLLSGLPTSVVRAAIMLSIVLLTSNQNKGLSSLWLTASLMLFLQPEWLIDLGFQLSVLAVFGIVRTASHPLEVNALIDKVFSSFKVTMAAQWHILPIILGVFRQFPSYFLIGNLLLLPLVSLVLYTALLWSLVLFIFPNWQFLGIILEFLCDLMLQGSSFIASLPNSVLSIPYLQWHIMLLGLAVWLFLSAWRSTRSPYYYLWTSLMLIVFVGFYQSSIQKEFITIHQNSNDLFLSIKTEDSLKIVSSKYVDLEHTKWSVFPHVEHNRVLREDTLWEWSGQVFLLDEEARYKFLEDEVDWYLSRTHLGFYAVDKTLGDTIWTSKASYSILPNSERDLYE